MSAAFYWLAVLVVFLLALIIPALVYESWLRSDYRAYLRHQRSQEAWRDLLVQGPGLPHHRHVKHTRPRIVKQGQVR